MGGGGGNWVGGGLGTSLLVLILWPLFHSRAELLLQTYKTAFQVGIHCTVR